ncbi:MAG: hypothetical protein P4L46_00320 [Fimbriimonas sp.]|nr:hypothetical protein [Fimbriimonas sp.]
MTEELGMLVKQPPNGKAIELPFRQWRFWACAFGMVPLAYANIVLVWLYFDSYMAFPSGAVVLAGAFLQVLACIWAVVASIRMLLWAKAKRKRGAPSGLSYLRLFLCIAAIVSVQAPFIVLGARLSAPRISDATWTKAAFGWRQKNLGF